MKHLQWSDSTLEGIRRSVKACSGVGFIFSDGLLYRHWVTRDVMGQMWKWSSWSYHRSAGAGTNATH